MTNLPATQSEHALSRSEKATQAHIERLKKANGAKKVGETKKTADPGKKGAEVPVFRFKTPANAKTTSAPKKTTTKGDDVKPTRYPMTTEEKKVTERRVITTTKAVAREAEVNEDRASTALKVTVEATIKPKTLDSGAQKAVIFQNTSKVKDRAEEKKSSLFESAVGKKIAAVPSEKGNVAMYMASTTEQLTPKTSKSDSVHTREIFLTNTAVNKKSAIPLLSKKQTIRMVPKGGVPLELHYLAQSLTNLEPEVVKKQPRSALKPTTIQKPPTQVKKPVSDKTTSVFERLYNRNGRSVKAEKMFGGFSQSPNHHHL